MVKKKKKNGDIAIFFLPIQLNLTLPLIVPCNSIPCLHLLPLPHGPTVSQVSFHHLSIPLPLATKYGRSSNLRPVRHLIVCFSFQIQARMHIVQQELQDLKSRLDTSAAERYNEDQQALVTKVESLKDEFKDLIVELRRKKSTQGATSMTDDVSVRKYDR